jgi:hypothetical protein
MLTGIIFSAVVTFLFTGGFAMTFPHFFGLVSRRQYDDSLTAQHAARIKAEQTALYLDGQLTELRALENCQGKILDGALENLKQMRQKIASLEAQLCLKD